ncbi:MAG: hypothetical protein VB055_01090 [Oscillospiraceae bacterium]|nr:hypothetical protein [Oscillospiraceae bacterium]
MKEFNLFLRGVFGGSLYCLTELLWRRYTHVSMFLVGGLCFLLLAELGRLPRPFFVRALLGAAAVTGVEFVSGCVLNLLLRLNVWDYSTLPLNLLGQVCLLYALLWIPLCAAGILFNQGLDRLQAQLPPLRRPGEAR